MAQHRGCTSSAELYYLRHLRSCAASPVGNKSTAGCGGAVSLMSATASKHGGSGATEHVASTFFVGMLYLEHLLPWAVSGVGNNSMWDYQMLDLCLRNVLHGFLQMFEQVLMLSPLEIGSCLFFLSWDKLFSLRLLRDCASRARSSPCRTALLCI